MIYFSRNKTQVHADIKAKIPLYEDRTLLWNWETGDEMYAGLLAETLKNQLGNKLAAIRKEAYESGFKDAKAKCKKQTDFWRGW